jgi:cytochrome bd-type quinol oxidase subunit 2
MIVLWLLILRGISIELRNHIEVGVWRALLDGVFGLASALLAIFFGAALANVLRGVPLNAAGYFFLPLWTNWQPGIHPGILDWYTAIGGLVALMALTLHGALWLTIKTSGELAQRARRLCCGPTIFSAEILQYVDVHCLLGHDLLQPRILSFQLFEAGDLGALHAAVLVAPAMQRLLADLQLARDLDERPPPDSAAHPRLATSPNRMSFLPQKAV